MANRYDRDPDEHGFGRRDGAREDERRPGEERQYGRHAPWHEGREERERAEQGRGQPWRGQEYRGSGGREGSRDERHGGYSQNDYYAGREAGLGRGYYSSGRDDSGERSQYPERGERQGFERQPRDWGARDERPSYRGYYQEQAWSRDPASGNVYGYEYGTRLDPREPRRFNAGDESGDRWRGDVGTQNRRFDIDRGWRGAGGAGTSGYGNTTRGQSQFGKGPKGYVRSDERIREDVCDRLSDDDEVDASDITVTVKNAEVILEGSVVDRRSKHRAEDIAESVSGVKEVTNHLRARKGFLQELGDKLSGNDDAEHHGHSGSGTRNSTSVAAPRAAH